MVIGLVVVLAFTYNSSCVAFLRPWHECNYFYIYFFLLELHVFWLVLLLLRLRCANLNVTRCVWQRHLSNFHFSWKCFRRVNRPCTYVCTRCMHQSSPVTSSGHGQPWHYRQLPKNINFTLFVMYRNRWQRERKREREGAGDRVGNNHHNYNDNNNNNNSSQLNIKSDSHGNRFHSGLS